MACLMAFHLTENDEHQHRNGHTMGDFPKKTSIGNGKRKKGSYGAKTKKPYRGQGR
jgi:hypothetical protein